MKNLLIILLFLPPSLLGQNEDNKSTKAGWAIQLGTGTMYGGLGTLVEKQILIKEKFRLTPYAGLGLSLGGKDTIKADYYWLNCAIGANMEYGKTHRLIWGAQIINSNDIYNTPSNAPINKKTLVGTSVITGYKGTTSFGLIWQAYLGLAYIQDPIVNDKKYFFEPHVGLGIGYKF